MKKILIVFDTPKWSNQEVAENINRQLGPDFEGSAVWAANAFPALLEQYDMVHFLFWRNWLHYKQQYGIPKIPSIVQIHHWMAEDDKWDEFREILSGTTLIGTSSKHWQGIMKAQGIMTEYMPLGVDTDFFRPAPRPKKNPEPIVGWVGLPSPRKGLVILDTVVPQAGQLLNIHDSHENRVSKEQLRAFYWDLDLYVSPARLEGGPMPVLEAMSCGIPTVITPTGMWRELVKSKGCAVMYPELWAKHYKTWSEKLLNDNQAKWSAREVAKEYDWKNIVHYYEAAYKACLSWREEQ